MWVYETEIGQTHSKWIQEVLSTTLEEQSNSLYTWKSNSRYYWFSNFSGCRTSQQIIEMYN